ncbi:MAG TPA: c-type cytochrome biogenesis protein CcmI [Pseudolabrys sp.]|nr:c-type cytochrome biogenesis protein CcmI [Pseudolabrys sp.]
MTLWFVLALMTMAAVFAVLWPLGRRAVARRGDSGSHADVGCADVGCADDGNHHDGNDLAVYRDQLREVDRDRATGLIADADAEAARIEISRRLLSAADAAAADDAARPRAASPWRRRIAAVAAFVVVPLVGVGFYLALGSPQLPGAPLAGRAAAPSATQSVAALVSQVEAHIERNPDDGRGWEVLAPVYLRLGRYDDALKARRQALALISETADRQADLGEAAVAAANGIVTGEARRAFERAVALDAAHTKARFYLGLAAEQDGKRDEAEQAWRALIAEAPAGAPWIPTVQEALTRIGAASVDGPALAPEQRPQPGAQANMPAKPDAAAGPSADDVAAAQALTPQQRQEMIAGMVARLADRLKADGADADGWVRLVRAYMVLGERDKARAAAADARQALAGAPDKLRRIDELVKSLGLEG